MNLLTLNTHSLVEECYEEKLKTFVEAVAEYKPDIIALQEVNQSRDSDVVNNDCLDGFVLGEDSPPVREDNHAYNILKLLREKKIRYECAWLGMKLGYGKYDEGIAVLSRSKIIECDSKLISGIDDYENWKTRKIIGIKTANASDSWFYSVHTGWWNDDEEPFQVQWERIKMHMKNRGRVWLMGDFNSPSEIIDEGYAKIVSDGWYDTFKLAKNKDSGITVGKVIDGWKDKISETNGMRIDQIWCNEKVSVERSDVVFNGMKKSVVSDHFGVMVKVI